jgi:hypothetical protein
MDNRSAASQKLQHFGQAFGLFFIQNSGRGDGNRPTRPPGAGEVRASASGINLM